MNRKMLQDNIAELLPEEDLDAVADLLNYPLREHKRMVEEHTDREVEIRTFTGPALQRILQRLGFEKGVEKIAELMKEEIDSGHEEIRDLLRDQE